MAATAITNPSTPRRTSGNIHPSPRSGWERCRWICSHSRVAEATPLTREAPISTAITPLVLFTTTCTAGGGDSTVSAT